MTLTKRLPAQKLFPFSRSVLTLYKKREIFYIVCCITDVVLDRNSLDTIVTSKVWATFAHVGMLPNQLTNPTLTMESSEVNNKY